MVGNDLISGKTALASEPADTDEFLVSDAGTLKRIDYSLIKSSGKLLQVAHNTHATRFTTSSTSYVAATGYTVAITPSATSSKIFVLVSTSMDNKAVDRTIYATLYRTISGGSAASVTDDAEGVAANYSAAGRQYTPVTLHTIDSPNTTSACTYQVYVKANVGSDVTFNDKEGIAQLTAFEIAG